MKFLILILLVLSTYNSFSQEKVEASNQIINTIRENFEIEKYSKKTILKEFKHKNPLNYIASSLLFLYQNVISEQISANCNYEISCSEYTKRAISKYGLIKGTLLGLHQLSCCHDNVKADIESYKISENGKIKNEM